MITDNVYLELFRYNQAALEIIIHLIFSGHDRKHTARNKYVTTASFLGMFYRHSLLHRLVDETQGNFSKSLSQAFRQNLRVTVTFHQYARRSHS